VLIFGAQGDSLLHSFIYPDSRAHFLEILGRAKLLLELNVSLGIGWSASEVDFWSYERGKRLAANSHVPCIA
jgi:hypothetical protein